MDTCSWMLVPQLENAFTSYVQSVITEVGSMAFGSNDFPVEILLEPPDRCGAQRVWRNILSQAVPLQVAACGFVQPCDHPGQQQRIWLCLYVWTGYLETF
mmetsp:Transcript_23872/g.38956  ORF Transcript_23872/g.38956 Transcript_23872/m.38956 type:complete len:100 (-) Transcript_23872:2758-3057(-)